MVLERLEPECLLRQFLYIRDFLGNNRDIPLNRYGECSLNNCSKTKGRELQRVTASNIKLIVEHFFRFWDVTSSRSS